MRCNHSISLITKREHYELTIRSKISVLLGMSATGKSTLYRIFLDRTLKKQCDAEVRQLQEQDWELTLKAYQDDVIFVCDEYCSYMDDDRFYALLKESRACFILITRNRLNRFPLSYLDIYRLVTVKGITKNVRKYEPFIPREQKPEMLITEDEKSSCIFFRRHLPQMTVVGIGAKSKLPQVIEQYAEQAENILVFADGDGIGAEYAKLRFQALEYRMNLMLPNSYEWLLLSSRMFARFPEIKEKLEHTERFLTTAYTGREQFWEKMLKSAMQTVKGQEYTKNSMQDCFTGKCCPFGLQCKWYITGDKFEIIVKERYPQIKFGTEEGKEETGAAGDWI